MLDFIPACLTAIAEFISCDAILPIVASVAAVILFKAVISLVK